MAEEFSQRQHQCAGSKPSFLGLPLKVRESIYRAAGLIPCCTLSLNGIPKNGTDGLAVEAASNNVVDRSGIRFGSKFIGPCKRGADAASACSFSWSWEKFLNIALTCRQVADEIMRLLYSESNFVVHRSANNGLQAIQRISRRNLARIRTLRIELNTTMFKHKWLHLHPEPSRDEVCQCRCNNGQVASSAYSFCTCDKPDPPLRANSDQFRQVLVGLDEMLSLFQDEIPPDQLDLGIICDVNDRSTAEFIAAKVLRFPTPRASAIRFSANSQPALSAIARDTVLKMTAAKAMSQTYLPAEILWNIFESAFIAPRDLEWKPTGKRPGINLHLQSILCPHFCEQVRGWTSSYSAFLSSCTCWRFPLELLVLNRFYRTQLLETFYRRNHFMMLPDRGYELPGWQGGDMIQHAKPPQYSYFGLNNHPFLLQHLTSIQFVLPMQGTTVTTIRSRFPDEPDLGIPLHWYQLVRAIFRLDRKQKLSIVIDFSTLDHRPKQEEPDIDGREAWQQRLIRVSRTIQSAMGSNIHSLQSFWIYVPQHVRAWGLESQYENRIMRIDDSQTTMKKYDRPNRFEFWHTFATGWTIQNGLFEDSRSW